MQGCEKVRAVCLGCHHQEDGQCTMEESLNVQKPPRPHDPKGQLDKIVRCPFCQRGDVWQEAVKRTMLIYRDDYALKVTTHLLASMVSVVLENAGQ